MKASTFGLLALVAAQPVEGPRFVVPNSADLKITIRRTINRSNTSVFTETIYLKGARCREERFVKLPSTVSLDQTHHGVTLTQCDERRLVDLNDDTLTYAVMPLVDWTAHLKAAGGQASRRQLPDMSGPEVKILVDSVDTGERRQLGRYVARHIVTTTITEAAPGAHHRSGRNEEDGWHIDLPTCWEQNDTRTFARPDGEVTRPGEPLDRTRYEFRGTARHGYTIEGTSRGAGAAAPVESIELIEFSEAALDPTLFTIPPNYRAALRRPYGGFDMTKPDTLLNRVELYCGLLATWAQSWFR